MLKYDINKSIKFEYTATANGFKVTDGFTYIGDVTENDHDLDAPEITTVDGYDYAVDNIKKDFLWYRSRPEYLVTSKYALQHALSRVAVCEDAIENRKQLIISLITGCALLRAHDNGVTDDTKIVDKVNTGVLAWLDTTDFYTAPASTRYHEAYAGGLVEHTLKVVENIINLNRLDKFSTVAPSSAVLCAIVHDFCKIGKYEPYAKNVKDDPTGQWVKTTAYKYRYEIMVPLGHGETSMYLASKFFNLTVAEAVAIRQHMGKWAAETSYNVSDLQYANENHPIVLLLQFADQLAIVKY